MSKDIIPTSFVLLALLATAASLVYAVPQFLALASPAPVRELLFIAVFCSDFSQIALKRHFRAFAHALGT